MPSIPLVALKGFAYHRRRLTKGDAFDALTASDAKVLRLAGMARDAGSVADAAVLPDADVAAIDTDYLHPADPQPDDPHAIPSPKRPRGRPKKYQTAELTPDES